jgi:hypothetical protein
MTAEDSSHLEDLDGPRLKTPQLKLTKKDLTFTNSAISHYDLPIILGLFLQLERLCF